MATIIVYLESAVDTPLTGAAPTLDYWDKSTPGAPAATGVAMTELVGGIGGGYFVDVATIDGREYLGLIDGTAGARAGTRYQMVVFSGETDARIETDIPAIYADTNAMQPTVATNLDATVSSRATQADILSDATPFQGADVAAILADTSVMQPLVSTNLDATVSSRSDFDESTDPVELLDSGGAAGTSAAELVVDVEANLSGAHGVGQWDGVATASDLWDYDITTNYSTAQRTTTAGGALRILRMGLTNQWHEDSDADPAYGTLILYEDGPGAAALTAQLTDEDGNALTPTTGVPARRTEST